MSTATYGELLARCESALLEAMTSHAQALPAEEVTDGATRLLRALAGHVRLLVPIGAPTDPDANLGTVHERAARGLIDALEPAQHYRPAPRDEAALATPWHVATLAVDSASQLLQQHLAREGQLSTPDTIHTLDGQQRWQALTRLAVIGRGAARELARIVDADDEVRPAARQRLLYITEPLTSRATLVLDIDTRTVHGPDRFAHLTKPHDLRRPPHETDAGGLLVEIVQRCALAAHRQATGERSVSRADLIGDALLASRLRVLQIQHDRFPHELARQASVRSLRGWVEAQRQWQDLQIRDVSPQGTAREIATALAILEGSPARPIRQAPSEQAINDGCQPLADLADANARTVTRLVRAGGLMQPTRQRQDVDWPYPWVAADGGRSDSLIAAYRRLVALEQPRDTVKRMLVARDTSRSRAIAPAQVRRD